MNASHHNYPPCSRRPRSLWLETYEWFIPPFTWQYFIHSRIWPFPLSCHLNAVRRCHPACGNEQPSLFRIPIWNGRTLPPFRGGILRYWSLIGFLRHAQSFILLPNKAIPSIGSSFLMTTSELRPWESIHKRIKGFSFSDLSPWSRYVCKMKRPSQTFRHLSGLLMVRSNLRFLYNSARILIVLDFFTVSSNYSTCSFVFTHWQVLSP